MNRAFAAASLTYVLLVSCTDGEENWKPEFPSHFPAFENPDPYPITKATFELGRDLFYESFLSSDSSISCSSCHLPSRAFSDPKKVSVGVHDTLGTRNAQALQNLNWAHTFFRDGTIHSLYRVPIAPLEADFEMNMNPIEMLKRINAHPQYPGRFLAAYGEPVAQKHVIYALVAFQRMLVTANSPFDHFYKGDSSAMSASQIAGWQLFNGKAGCASCHVGVNFSDEAYHNIGLYTDYSDEGRERFTFKKEDDGKFKTPNLRNIAVTGPYMHDGSMASLEAVIAHYNSGGMTHPNKDIRVKPLGLNEIEQQELLSFLQALTDETFISNPVFQYKGGGQ